MEIIDLLPDSSRRTADIAVSFIGNNPDFFQQMLDIALKDSGTLSMRAARVVNLVSVNHPHLIRPHISSFIPSLSEFKTDGLKRELAKTIWQRSLDIDEESMGILVDTCFFWLKDPYEKVAIKVYAMEIIYKISQLYPEIKNELISTVENMMPRSSFGIKSRGRKLLKKLYREVEG